MNNGWSEREKEQLAAVDAEIRKKQGEWEETRGKTVDMERTYGDMEEVITLKRESDMLQKICDELEGDIDYFYSFDKF